MAQQKRGLLLTSSEVIASSSIAAFSAAVNFATKDIVDIITQSATLAGKGLPLASSSVAALLSISDCPGLHSEGFLAELSRVLKPGGTLFLQEPVARRSVAPQELKAVGQSKTALLQSQAGLERALLLTGFTGVVSAPAVVESQLAAEWSGITPAAVGSVQGALLQPLTLKAEKPKWETGSSFTLKRKHPKKETSIGHSPAVAPTVNGAAVKLSVGDLHEGSIDNPVLNGPTTTNLWTIAGDDEELVDEDSLLTEEDMVRPVVPAAVDCGVGQASRKACKNCTCGRAEAEAAADKPQAVRLTAGQMENPQSACGSCGLGDAFRCAGCPYRGLPPFQLGQKVSLPSSMLAADV